MTPRGPLRSIVDREFRENMTFQIRGGGAYGGSWILTLRCGHVEKRKGSAITSSTKAVGCRTCKLNGGGP